MCAVGLREPGNHDNGASDLWTLTAYKALQYCYTAVTAFPQVDDWDISFCWRSSSQCCNTGWLNLSYPNSKLLKIYHIFMQLSYPLIQYLMWRTIDMFTRAKIKFLFSGATFHIPLTKSATLNRLLHCSLWQFSGLCLIFGGSFWHFRGEIAGSPCVIFPWIVH